MTDLEEDIHEIISGCVLTNRRILDQEHLLLEVLRKKERKEQSNRHGQKEAERVSRK